MTELPGLVELISRAILDEPPLAVREGGLIRDGFDSGLDELRTAMRGGKDWIAKLQQDEITRTGIQSLKVRFNSVFGYYIEVTRSNLEKVPADYVRKQTIANGERFITPELKEYEDKIFKAEEKIASLESQLFNELRLMIAGETESIQQNAGLVALLDCFVSLAEVAAENGYVLPEIADRKCKAKEFCLFAKAGIRFWSSTPAKSDLCPMKQRWTAALPRLRTMRVRKAMVFPKSCSSPARTWPERALTSGRLRC